MSISSRLVTPLTPVAGETASTTGERPYSIATAPPARSASDRLDAAGAADARQHVHIQAGIGFLERIRQNLHGAERGAGAADLQNGFLCRRGRGCAHPDNSQ
jgi:hypothetical protein